MRRREDNNIGCAREPGRGDVPRLPLAPEANDNYTSIIHMIALCIVLGCLVWLSAIPFQDRARETWSGRLTLGQGETQREQHDDDDDDERERMKTGISTPYGYLKMPPLPSSSSSCSS